MPIFSLTSAVVLLLLLQYALWLGGGGVVDNMRLDRLMAKQRQANQAADERNQILITRIDHLKNVKGIVESLAREQIGLIKPNETYYQFVSSEQ